MNFVRRNTIRISFVKAHPRLQKLESRVPIDSPFTKKYGRLLSLATFNFQEEMMCVLIKFFDPIHHCFTFPDYHLVPTLEEFSLLLGVPMLHQIPFNGLEGILKPEVIAEALHLKRAEIIENWERSRV